MHKILSYLLIFTLTLRIFYADVHLLWYKIDTNSYVRLFCENTAIPEKHCNGQCSINQVLKDSSGQDQQRHEGKLTIFSISEFVPITLASVLIRSFKANDIKPIWYLTHFYFFAYLHMIAHPPEF